MKSILQEDGIDIDVYLDWPQMQCTIHKSCNHCKTNKLSERSMFESKQHPLSERAYGKPKTEN